MPPDVTVTVTSQTYRDGTTPNGGPALTSKQLETEGWAPSYPARERACVSRGVGGSGADIESPVSGMQTPAPEGPLSGGSGTASMGAQGGPGWGALTDVLQGLDKIGRASCRERV